MKRVWLGLAGLCLCCVSAQAQDFGLSEVRVGVQSHDAYNGFLPFTSENYRFNGITDLSFDVIFRSPEVDAFRWIGSPRPRIGATVSMQGLDSIAHAGLLWQLPLGDTFYLEAGFGAAIIPVRWAKPACRTAGSGAAWASMNRSGSGPISAPIPP